MTWPWTRRWTAWHAALDDAGLLHRWTWRRSRWTDALRPRDRRAGLGAHLVAPLSRRGHGRLCRAQRRDARRDRNAAAAAPLGEQAIPVDTGDPLPAGHERRDHDRGHAACAPAQRRRWRRRDRNSGGRRAVGRCRADGRGHRRDRVGAARQPPAAPARPGRDRRLRAYRSDASIAARASPSCPRARNWSSPAATCIRATSSSTTRCAWARRPRKPAAS